MSDSEKAPAPDVEVQHHEVAELAYPLRKVEHVLNADLAEALSTGPQLKVFSGSAFRLYLILLVCFMGSLSFGFDTTGEFFISGVNGMVQFTDYFGIGGGDTGGGQGIVTAMLYSIFSFGCILATFVGGPISDRFGRRGGMFIASIIILAGVAVVTAAQSRIYLFFGRFLIGFGSALNASASPAYVAEVSPPQWRGRIAFSYLGSVICSGLVIATGRINSDVSWRLPCAVQFIPTIILAVGVWFIPESPRWLMSVGRKEEARDVLARYHGNGMVSPLVILELRELEASISTGSDKGWYMPRDFFDYSELFNSRAARYRTFLTSWLGICCQLSGGGLFYYITVLFDLAGVKTQNGRLTFSFVSVAIGALGGLTGAFAVDKIGRRTLWFWGTVGCSLTLALAAGTQFPGLEVRSSQPVRSVHRKIGVRCGYHVPQNSLPAECRDLGIYACECLSYSARAKGLALFALIQSLASLVNNFAGSVAFQSIGWKYILVPACWSAVETVVIWFCAVETKGRTLEQLDEIFADPHPVKASLNKYRSSGEGGN
ncbi:general substrate transporter [Mycena metata]|uniref:General substrate transporter n=1 Tax=Mycena metata TaxID=1033252 RepID=A0AAD7K4P3_9AGAR|nr:general substrate transporter [Mycena metata]